MRKLNIYQKLKIIGLLLSLFLISSYGKQFFGTSEVWILLKFFSFMGTLFIFSRLIFYQKSKYTSINFIILVSLILIRFVFYIFIDILTLKNITDYNFLLFSIFDIDFLAILIGLFAVINGFKTEWIHYLNKNQKLKTFFIGVALYVVSFKYIYHLPFETSEQIFFPESITNSLTIFYYIYFAIALNSILIHIPSAGILDRKIQQIRSFQQIINEINTILDIQSLLNKTVEHSQKLLNADYTWIEKFESDGPKIVASYGLPSHEINEIPRDLIDKVIRQLENEPIYFNNQFIGRKNPWYKSWQKKISSVIAIKLLDNEKDFGILYAACSGQYAFQEETKELLTSFIKQINAVIKNIQLLQTTLRQERYREELRVAHNAQMKLIPNQFSEHPLIEIEGFCWTANEVGGDFFDVIPIDEQRTVFFIGDVSGKGANAAFYMAELKGMLQALAYHILSPKDIATEINALIQKTLERSAFVTMSYGIIEHQKKLIRFVRCGHLPLLLARDNDMKMIEPRGIGLGLAPAAFFKEQTEEIEIKLKPDDIVFMYTDGLIEARDPQENEFGEDKLNQFLLSINQLDPKLIIKNIQAELNGFMKSISRFDDISVLTFRVKK